MGDDMDKVKEVDNGFNHGITLVERKNIVISGVKKIESFDSEEFLMETTLGYLVIKGNELEIIKLDTYQGNVSIKGKIDSMVYLDSNNKKDNDNSLLNNLNKRIDNYLLIIIVLGVETLLLLLILLISFINNKKRKKKIRKIMKEKLEKDTPLENKKELDKEENKDNTLETKTEV